MTRSPSKAQKHRLVISSKPIKMAVGTWNPTLDEAQFKGALKTI